MAQPQGCERKNRIHGYTLQLGRVRTAEPRTQTTTELILFDQFDHESAHPVETGGTLYVRAGFCNGTELRDVARAVALTVIHNFAALAP